MLYGGPFGPGRGGFSLLALSEFFENHLWPDKFQGMMLDAVLDIIPARY
jgi:hypothetical protein